MTSHKHSHRIISRLVAVSGIVAVSALIGIANPINARAATVAPGSYSPTSSTYTFTDLIPSGPSVQGTVTRSSSTTNTVQVYARCAASRGASSVNAQLVQSFSSGGSSFTFGNAAACTGSGTNVVTGVEIRELVPAGGTGCFGISPTPAGCSQTYVAPAYSRFPGYTMVMKASPTRYPTVQGGGGNFTTPATFTLQLTEDNGAAQLNTMYWTCSINNDASQSSFRSSSFTPPTTVGQTVTISQNPACLSTDYSVTHIYFGNPGYGTSIVWQIYAFGATAVSGTSTTMVGYNFTVDNASNSAYSVARCTITDDQIAVLARTAGLAEDKIPTAVAIAIAESGNNTTARNFNTNGSVDFGLWQINNVAHPEYLTDSLLSNPQYNAGAMKAIYTTASGWSPWSTYKNAAYGRYMDRGTAATSHTTGNTFTSPVGTTCPIGGNGAANTSEDPNNTSNTDDCGWTINLLKVFKCLFIPQHSDDYAAKANTLVNTGAIGTLGNAFTYVTETVAVYKYCNDAGTNDESCGGTLTLPGMQQVGHEGHPAKTLTGEASGLYNGSPYLMYFKQATQFIIIVMFGYYWWNRLTASLGGKGD